MQNLQLLHLALTTLKSIRIRTGQLGEYFKVVHSSQLKTNPPGQGTRPFPSFGLAVFLHRTMHLCLSVVWQFWACAWGVHRSVHLGYTSLVPGAHTAVPQVHNSIPLGIHSCDAGPELCTPGLQIPQNALPLG